jgi:N-acetylglucosaminyl-diphospho-decaprenol L-rhamnosyltransferase
MAAGVTVVVVTYSSGDTLPAFMDSLQGASTGLVDIIAVDNGSTDDTLDYLRARPDVQLIESGSNRGYGGAANLGAARASTPWILVANPDVTFRPGSLDALLDVAARWPRAGALGPRIHTSDGLLYPSARELPSVGSGVGHAVFGWVWPSNPWTASYRRERGEPLESTTGWLSGSCLLLRRTAFEEVDGFDEDYFMYFEDTDLCERLSKSGWDIVYAPSAVVVHEGGHATSRQVDRMTRAHHASAYRYLSRRYHGGRWVGVRLVLRVGLWARFQVARRVGRVTHGATPTRRA